MRSLGPDLNGLVSKQDQLGPGLSNAEGSHSTRSVSIHVAVDHCAIRFLDLLRRFILEGALIQFIVLHGLLLHADLVLDQEVDERVAVDQSDRSVNGISVSLS